MSEESPFSPLTPAEWIDDDSAIKQVRQIRLAMLDKQTMHGMPTDPESFEMLHKNLQEIDKGAFKSKQLKQEEKSSEANARLAKEISEAMVRNIGVNLFRANDEIGHGVTPPDHITGHVTPAPGELKQGDDSTSYEVFSATVGKELDELRRGEDTD